MTTSVPAPRSGGGEELRAPWSYAAAVAIVCVALGLKLLLIHELSRTAPFLLMLGAICASTWLGGRGPGVLALGLAAGAVTWVFLPSYYGPGPLGVGAHAAVFGVEGALVVYLTSLTQAARRRAEGLADRMRHLARINAALARSRAIPEVAGVVATEGVEALGAAGAAVYTRTVPGGRLRLVASAGEEVGPAEREVPSDGDLPVAAAVRTGEILCVETPAAMLCAPMATPSGVVGAIVLRFAGARGFGDDDRAFARTLAQDCAFAVERARLYDLEQRARADAEEANRTKDELLGIVSHELRAPLTSILGWTRMLRICDGMDEGARERALDVIERNARAQARLVEDVLDISRIAARRLQVERRAVDMTPLVRACVEDLRHAAASRGVELTFAGAGALAVSGDPERLRQVATNLVSNALKFTPRGGHVRVALEAVDGAVRLEVRDDGAGIAPAELPYVFEPFRQAGLPRARRQGGLGLGLAIVRSLVEQHGGTVALASDGPDRGATATVRLPLQAELPEATPPERESGAALAVH